MKDIKLLKEKMNFEHKLKLERENLRHKNIMEEIKELARCTASFER